MISVDKILKLIGRVREAREALKIKDLEVLPSVTTTDDTPTSIGSFLVPNDNIGQGKIQVSAFNQASSHMKTWIFRFQVESDGGSVTIMGEPILEEIEEGESTYTLDCTINGGTGSIAIVGTGNDSETWTWLASALIGNIYE